MLFLGHGRPSGGCPSGEGTRAALFQKRTYCTLDYLMEHLDKAAVEEKVTAWRETLVGELSAAFA